LLGVDVGLASVLSPSPPFLSCNPASVWHSQLVIRASAHSHHQLAMSGFESGEIWQSHEEILQEIQSFIFQGNEERQAARTCNQTCQQHCSSYLQ
jgi:hypothetical protein